MKATRAKVAAAFLGVLLAGCPRPAPAQEVLLPPEVKGNRGVPIQIVPIKVDGGTPEWKVGKGLTKFDISALVEIDWPEDPKTPEDAKARPSLKLKGIVVYGEEGEYEVWAWNAKGSKASKLAVTRVVIGNPQPQPPPGPGPVPPGPNPPGPTPPDAAPIPAAGLHVLIVEESKDRGKYKPGQLAAIYNKDFRAYVLQHTAKDNGVAGIWHIDKDDDPGGLPKHFQAGAAFALKDASPFPRVLVCNPAKGFFMGTVPDSAQALIDLVKKYE